ncbi:unnamed protein product [Rotaria magnacalcarata]|uniref:Uncharacterized protein n=1 Tax=Rotaria magnacalcarata TaxID=392030 RepID=A0A815GK91_9BILA|nr:unnamed protein product [Rotaria magnacalcarata]
MKLPVVFLLCFRLTLGELIFMLKLSHFIFGYLIFLLFGTLIFYESNTVEEKKRHIQVNNHIRQFIQRNNVCLKEHDLYPYVDYFLDKSHTGLWHSSLSNTNTTKWTFGQGLFFVTSLITTVEQESLKS